MWCRNIHFLLRLSTNCLGQEVRKGKHAWQDWSKVARSSEPGRPLEETRVVCAWLCVCVYTPTMNKLRGSRYRPPRSVPYGGGNLHWGLWKGKYKETTTDAHKQDWAIPFLIRCLRRTKANYGTYMWWCIRVYKGSMVYLLNLQPLNIVYYY